MADAIMSILIGVALWRRPSKAIFLLAVSWMIGMGMSGVGRHDDLRPLLMANDALLMVALSYVHDEAETHITQLVASLSMLSISIGFAAVAGGWNWNTYAAAVNIIAIMQVLFAGGLCDGLLRWLGHRYRELLGGRDYAFRDIGAFT